MTVRASQVRVFRERVSLSGEFSPMGKSSSTDSTPSSLLMKRRCEETGKFSGSPARQTSLVFSTNVILPLIAQMEISDRSVVTLFWNRLRVDPK